MTIALGLPACNPLLSEQHNNARMVDLFNIDDIAMTTLLSHGDAAGLQKLYDSTLGPFQRRKDLDQERNDKGRPKSFSANKKRRRSTLNTMLAPLAGQSNLAGSEYDDTYVVPHSLMKPSATLKMEKLSEVQEGSVAHAPGSTLRRPTTSTLYSNGAGANNSPVSARSAKLLQSKYVPSATPTTASFSRNNNNTPTAQAYGMSRGGLRMVGALVPALGAHVIIKFHHDFSSEEKVGECIVSLSHLLESQGLTPEALAASGGAAGGGGNEKGPVHIKDIPVSNGGLYLGTASGHFQLTFLGACERMP